MEAKVLKYDDSLIGAMNSTQLANYLLNKTAYSNIPWKLKKDPTGWAIPFVTNHKYKMHWRTGLDFEIMRFDLSSKWTATDKNV